VSLLQGFAAASGLDDLLLGAAQAIGGLLGLDGVAIAGEADGRIALWTWGEFPGALPHSLPMAEAMTSRSCVLRGSSGDVSGSQPDGCVAIPLLSGEKVLGALVASQNGRSIPQEAVAALEFIVGQLALRIANLGLQDLERAHVELELRQEEMLRHMNALEAVFNGFPHGLFVVDAQQRVVAVNRVQARGEGEPGAIIGQPCSVAFAGGACAGCRIGETLAQGRITRRTVSMAREDGARREMEISTYPILDESSPPARAAMVVVRDVTEQRQLESSLLRVEKLVALGRMAAGIAHEINNPLAAIMANVQLLRGSIEEGTPAYESLEIVARAAERAGRVAGNLHSFAGEEQYRFAPTEVNATIERALELVGAQLRHCSIEVERDLSDSLPQIMASGEHLETVWLNLALDVMEDIRGRGRAGRLVCTSGFLGSGCLRVTFGDGELAAESPGLLAALDPFSSEKLEVGGAGLGLGSAHNILKRHGGQLRVNAEGEGARFFEVLLPTRALDARQPLPRDRRA